MRVISLSPAITEIMFALKAGDLIMANTYFCDYPTEAKKIPKVGSFSHVDFDKIKSLKPDLVLTSTIVQKSIYTELINRHVNTVYTDPRSLKDIIASIELIGKLISKEKEALKVINNMKKEINKFKENQLSQKLRIYIEEWYDPPMYSGNWVPDIVELAGGKYGLGKKGDISRDTSLDRLLKFDPEYIFVSYCGFGTKSDPNKVLNRKGWKNISAVKNKKVFSLNETILNRPGPRILESAKEIQKYLNL